MECKHAAMQAKHPKMWLMRFQVPTDRRVVELCKRYIGAVHAPVMTSRLPKLGHQWWPTMVHTAASAS